MKEKFKKHKTNNLNLSPPESDYNYTGNKRTKGFDSAAKLRRCDGVEVKHEHLVPHEMIRVKFPPKNDNEAEVF